MTLLALTVAVVALVVLMLYVVRQAAILKMTADGLQGEIRQFKEGGLSKLVQDQIALLTQQAAEGRTSLLEQQAQSTKSVAQIQQDVGAVKQQIDTLRDLQHHVGELKDLLKPQQLRGELGEVIVRTLIADKLPKGQYEEDHTFANGKRVEFVIKLSGKLIPIDSKLQLEDFKRLREAVDERQRQTCRTEFKRAVRQKIDEVKEYIQPTEGTYDFALMVIPSEAVYYDLIANKDFTEAGGLYDYARKQKVFLVSPLTFWAYLTALAQGLHGLEIGRRAEEILANLQTIAAKIRNFSHDEFRVLGIHLRDAEKRYTDAEAKLKTIEGNVSALERIEPAELSHQGALT